MERRRFLAAVAGSGVAAALGGCAALAATPVRLSGGRVRLAPRNHPELRTPGGFLKIRLEGSGDVFYVLALDEGDYAVLSPICTHQGCTVGVEGRNLVCPCHGSTYRRDGRVVRGPAPRPLTRLPARLTEGGVLVIETGKAG